MRPYRDLLKHSSIYGVGQVLGRVASVLLLPVYTHVLTPSDYGAVAILDLTAALLSVLIGSGMASAVTRFHFSTEDERERDAVWWTGAGWIVVMASAVVLPLFLIRGSLADWTLGDAFPRGGLFYAMALATLWFGTIGQVTETYLRVQKWSTLFVAISLGRLLVNVALNVWFLLGLHWGVLGLLTGNLIATILTTGVQFAVFARSRRNPSIDREILRRLFHFGGPLVITALLSMLMHEADRYLLRLFLSMEEVGIYSLAYKVGDAVNTLCLLPFGAIWGVVMYEIAERPGARDVYATVFKHFVYGMMLVMLGVALVAKPALAILASEEYAAAADLVPIVLLAYVLFALHSQFNVPALLARRTVALLPAATAGVIVNVIGNVLLIPRLGTYGAAWASVLTYATFSFVGLMLYRRIDRYDYPFGRMSLVAGGIVGTFLLFRAQVATRWDGWTQIGIAFAVWAVWALALGIPVMGKLKREGQ